MGRKEREGKREKEGERRKAREGKREKERERRKEREGKREKERERRKESEGKRAKERERLPVDGLQPFVGSLSRRLDVVVVVVRETVAEPLVVQPLLPKAEVEHGAH